MAQGNNVVVVGNLVEEPELRFTASGLPFAKIRLAVNERTKNSSGEWIDAEPSFFGGTVWRDQAENAGESLSKGDRVIITGRLKQNRWENSEGEKRSAVEIMIDELGPSLRWKTARVVDPKTGSTTAGSAPPPPQPRDDYGPDEAPF